MLKEAAGIAGGALLLPPLGVSIVACGLPGVLVAGAGIYLADAVLKGVNASRSQADVGVAVSHVPEEGP